LFYRIVKYTQSQEGVWPVEVSRGGHSHEVGSGFDHWQSWADFIKLFFACYRRLALSFDSGYSVKDINYAEKSFMKLTPLGNIIKLFLSQSLLLACTNTPADYGI
jgi:hypothetical protein